MVFHGTLILFGAKNAAFGVFILIFALVLLKDGRRPFSMADL